MSGPVRRLIIAGSRSIDDRVVVLEALHESPWNLGNLEEVVHGGADGVDSIIEDIISQLASPETTVFDPSDPDSKTSYSWREHGKPAGPLRNEEMANYGDALLAIWDGDSPGTEDMIDKALSRNLDTYVVISDEE